MTDDFIIPLNGLKPGKTDFSWHCGKEFFERFGNGEILDADIDVEAQVEKSGSYLGVDCVIRGTALTLCDRCADDLTLPVETDARLSVKFGAEPVQEGEVVLSEEGEREAVYLPEDGGDMDMSQVVYDYVCLAMPVQRMHEEGKCNPLSLKYLSGDDTAFEEEGSEERSGTYSPFAVLKGLIDNKK